MTTSGSRPALMESGNGPVLRFIFVPDGAEASAEALARIASPIRIPATFVPDAAGAGTRAERRPGWSETFAPQSGSAGAAPAYDDGAAATENVAAGSDGAQRRPAAYGWPAAAAAAPVSTSKGRELARDGSMGDRPPAVIPVIDPHARRPDPRAAPVPFIDDNGNTVWKQDNKQHKTPMLRPAGLDPHMFVRQGLQDKKLEDMMSSAKNAGAVIARFAYEGRQLLRFFRWLSWDSQRIGGSFNPDFVDYATVAIGLYAAANGIPEETILEIENLAAITGHWSKKEAKDEIFTHLPKRNVKNTDLGYELYREGRIGPQGSP